MPSPYLTRRLRSYEEVDAAKTEQRVEDRQTIGPWQAALPVAGDAGAQEPATGEYRAA